MFLLSRGKLSQSEGAAEDEGQNPSSPARAKRRAKTRTLVLVALASLFFTNFASAEEKIDINTAPLEELLKITQIGEVRAKELISLRPFSSLDELIKIKGIGEKRLAAIKEQGLAWVAPQTIQPDPKPELELPELESNPNPAPAVYPSGVFINEILPSPQGPDEQEEWIEIFNQNNFEADLSDWQIKDAKSAGFVFPKDTIIASQGFLVLKRPETNIILNNNGDNLNLAKPDGTAADSVIYEKAPQGQSFNRRNSNWEWSAVLTPGSQNIISIPKIISTPAQPNIPSSRLIAEPIARPNANIKEAVSVIPKNSHFSLLFFSIPLAILSGFAILFLKKHVRPLSRQNN